MRKFTGLLSILVLVVSASFAQEKDYYDYSYARLNHVQGDVFVQRTEDLGQESGVVNLVLVEGDKLGTRGGRAELHFGRRNFLRLDNYTEVEFAGLPRSGYDQVRLNLLEGEVFLRVDFMEMEKDFELHTSDASFYILDIGLYRWRVDKHGQTEVEVIEGELEAAGEARSELVKTGELLRISQGRIISGPSRTYARISSSFYEWNRGREAFHNRSYATSYLPEELNEYEAELNHNGRWVYEQAYGNVWIPNVYHSTWRPYYNGRWMWYPICGWTWISYDPWGWCVHHYGRWQWRFGLGWYWIPTSHWGPAWVSWYHGSHHYGWCPLSYYGYPGVIINNHYYGNSNHYYNSYPAHSRAMVMVNKNQLQDPNISRVALSSGQVRNLNKVSLSKSQPSLRPTSTARQKTNAKMTSRANPRALNSTYSSRSSQQTRSRSSASRATDASGSRLSPSRSVSSSTRAISRSASQPGTKSYASRTAARASSNRNTAPQSSSSRVGRSNTAKSGSGISRYPSTRTSSRSSSSRSASDNTTSRSSSRSTIARTPSRSTVTRSPSRTSASRTSSRSTASRTTSRAPASRNTASSRTSRSSVSRSPSRSSSSRSTSGLSSRSSPSRASSGSRSSSVSSRSSSRSSSRASGSSSRSSVSRSSSSSRSSAGRSSSSRSSTSRSRSSSRVKKK